MMRIIVQKFGGTSIGTQDGRTKAVEKITAAQAEGFSPVVVVSSMGRLGDPYSSDTLQGLVQATGAQISRHDMDLLLSCGDIVSAVMIVQTLEAAGMPAIALTGSQAGIITDERFGEAQVVDVIPDRILRHLGEGKVVVVTGFQAASRSGDITTLGRGGADTTAALLACALDAEAVEIYTDVDGVMTSDPEIVPEARILRRLNYREICELATNGSNVIHPKAVEMMRDKAIPVRVRNTFSKDEGTLIADGSVSRIVTGLAQQPGLAQVFIRPEEGPLSPLDSVRVFKTLAGAGISVDMNSVSSDRITFVVKQNTLERTLMLLEPFAYRLETAAHCAKVSLVGAGMQETPGIMAQVVEAMHQAGIAIIQTADSEITISCLIGEDDVNRAVQCLHREFGLGVG